MLRSERSARLEAWATTKPLPHHERSRRSPADRGGAHRALRAVLSLAGHHHRHDGRCVDGAGDDHRQRRGARCHGRLRHRPGQGAVDVVGLHGDDDRRHADQCVAERHPGRAPHLRGRAVLLLGGRADGRLGADRGCADLRPRPAGLQCGRGAASGHGHDLHCLSAGASRHGDGRVRPGRRLRAGDRPDAGRVDDRILLVALRLLHLAAVLRRRRRARHGLHADPADPQGHPAVRLAGLRASLHRAAGPDDRHRRRPARGLGLRRDRVPAGARGRGHRGLRVLGALHAAGAARRAHLRKCGVRRGSPDRLHLRRRHDGLDLHHPGLRADHHRLHAASWPG